MRNFITGGGFCRGKTGRVQFSFSFGKIPHNVPLHARFSWIIMKVPVRAGDRLSSTKIGYGGYAYGSQTAYRYYRLRRHCQRQAYALAEKDRHGGDGRFLRHCEGTGGKGRQGIRHPGRPGVYRLQRAAEGKGYRRGACADPQQAAFLHYGGRAGSGQARYVRKAHGHQFRRGQEDAGRGQAHRQEADHRLSEPLPSGQHVPEKGL